MSERPQLATDRPLLVTDRPLLVTERFELWRPRASDLPDLCALLADPETRRFLGPANPDPQPQFERLMRNAGSWSLYGYGTFYVRPHGRPDLVASCGVFHSWRGFGPALGLDDTAEAGWIVRRDHWGQGVASEVMQAVLAWFCETHGARRVACMIEQGNIASERVAARLGFVRYASHTMEDDQVVLNLFERTPTPTPTPTPSAR